jgi:23S rRNA G2445 N2-methylase RlmL
VVSNPPWDLRLSRGAEDSWEDLGRFLREELGGGEAWLLSGNPEMNKHLGLR